MNVDNTLDERGKNYGEYINLATLSQSFKAVLRDSPNWNALGHDMQESLDMICHKMARILNGNPYHFDSWHDIIGYARLIESELDKDK